ncbi:MAG: hypothetical protein Q9164_002951 [Protoblastenia rupestris]
MSQRYPSNGQAYTTDELLNTRQPKSFLPAALPAPSDALSQEALSSSQALPPLSTSNYPSTLGNDPFLPSRAQPAQSSTLTNPIPSNPTEAFPIYAPSSSTHFVSHNALTPRPFVQQAPFVSNLHGTVGPSRPAHTTTAPSNIQLPKIQPAPAINGDIKPSFLQDEKGLHYLASALPPPAQEAPLKHVVGSQGRRGILPSAAGRPPALTASSVNGGKNSPALAKDSDGKYPCPHCSKPYLHAKHLKRHMLRRKINLMLFSQSTNTSIDTGVRPYECALCHDTFSRSDILKRHFQKCSVRRGNPTGENHLAYSRANKKAKQSEEESIAAGLNSMTTEQVSSLPTYTASLDSPMGLAGMGIDQQNYAEKQEPLANQVTRSNGIRKVSGMGTTSNRDSTSSLGTSVFDPTSSAFSTGHVTPDSVTTSGAATPYTYPHEARSSLNSPADASFSHSMGVGLGGSRLSTSSVYANGNLPHIAGQPRPDFDWSSAFQSYTSNDEFGNGPYHSGTSTPHHNYKHDPDLTNAFDWPLPQTKP